MVYKCWLIMQMRAEEHLECWPVKLVWDHGCGGRGGMVAVGPNRGEAKVRMRIVCRCLCVSCHEKVEADDESEEEDKEDSTGVS